MRAVWLVLALVIAACQRGEVPRIDPNEARTAYDMKDYRRCAQLFAAQKKALGF